MQNLTNKTIALAGVFQCAYIVNTIAYKGFCDSHDLEVMVRSILNQNPTSTLEVFGRYDNLRTGLHALTLYLSSGSQQRDINVARHVISLLHLARKVSKQPKLLQQISERLPQVTQQVELFGIIHQNVLSNLADVYRDTISTVSPRIIVNGEASFLSNPANADKIRSLLLSGIRAAILWQQAGGSRWQILWYRQKIVNEARRILTDEMSTALH